MQTRRSGARQREEAFVGYRSQRSQGIQASIPDVIVDGTVHMLKVELYEAILAFCAKDEGFGFTTSRLTGWAANFFDLLQQHVSVAKEHISICALVHSSWLLAQGASSSRSRIGGRRERVTPSARCALFQIAKRPSSALESYELSCHLPRT